MWFRQGQFYCRTAAFDLNPARGGAPVATRREPVETGAPLTAKAPAGRQNFFEELSPPFEGFKSEKIAPGPPAYAGGKRSDTPSGFRGELSTSLGVTS
jgi:hypothetical protein